MFFLLSPFLCQAEITQEWLEGQVRIYTDLTFYSSSGDDSDKHDERRIYFLLGKWCAYNEVLEAFISQDLFDAEDYSQKTDC